MVTSDDNTALANVLITTNPATESVMTGPEGEFVFTDLAEGTYVVSAEKDGYERGNVSVTVRGGKEVRAIITMTRETSTKVVPAPKIVSPQDNSVEQGQTVILTWARGVVHPRDSIYYSLMVYDGGTSERVAHATDLRDTSFTLSGLRFGSTYFWQVIASNGEGAATNGDVWSFQIRRIPDNSILYTAYAGSSLEIFSTDSTLQNTLQLTFEPSRELWPRWNRQRSKIAFVSDREGAYNIYIMAADGSDVRRVTTLPIAGYQNNGVGYCWSPDAGWIFYGHYDKLYRVDQFGANMALIATAPAGRHFREIEWSQQYDRLVVHTVGANPYDSEIYLMNPDGSILKELMGNVPGSLGSPSFSIDGGSVLFTRDLSGYEAADGRQLNAHIFSISVDQKDTLDISQMKPDGTNDLFPRFSPDGAWVIFTNMPNDNSTFGAVWIMRRDGSARRRLVLSGLYPDWK
ncbi:MAG: carboxypeptidase regulatory-like domain-containing protein [Bacteroidetes bacterium]|nr:carboxypeptidase regulatory-like domain-containing protein [Bacteroidota bacterium]